MEKFEKWRKEAEKRKIEFERRQQEIKNKINIQL